MNDKCTQWHFCILAGWSSSISLHCPTLGSPFCSLLSAVPLLGMVENLSVHTQPSSQPRPWRQPAHRLLGRWSCASSCFSLTSVSYKFSCLCRPRLQSLSPQLSLSTALTLGFTFQCIVKKVLLGRKLWENWSQFSLLSAGCLLCNSWKQVPHIFCPVLELFFREGKLIPVISSWLETSFTIIGI